VKIAQGINPVTEKKRARALTVTLENVLNDYLESKTLKPVTKLEYVRVMNETFRDYLGKPLSKITETVVRKKYLERGKRSPARAVLARRVVSALFNFARARYKLPDGGSCFPTNPTGAIADLVGLQPEKVLLAAIAKYRTRFVVNGRANRNAEYAAIRYVLGKECPHRFVLYLASHCTTTTVDIPLQLNQFFALVLHLRSIRIVVIPTLVVIPLKMAGRHLDHALMSAHRRMFFHGNMAVF